MKGLWRFVWILLLLFCIVESASFIIETCTPTGSLARGKLAPVVRARTAALGVTLLIGSLALLWWTVKSWLGGGDGESTPADRTGKWFKFGSVTYHL